MATPPLPPRPYDYNSNQYQQPRKSSLPPPVPPLPPNFRPDPQDYPAPHFADPLVAPRPQKLTSNVPSDMALSLDDQAFSMNQPPISLPVAMPGNRRASGAADSSRYGPPPGAYSPGIPGSPPTSWNNPRTSLYSSPPPVPPQPNYNSSPRHDTLALNQSFQNLTFQDPPRGQPPPPPRPQPSPPRMNAQGQPALTANLPTVQSLSDTQGVTDPAQRIAWAKDVLYLVDRSQGAGGTSSNVGPAKITDPALYDLAGTAVQTILALAPHPPLPAQAPPHLAEAVCLRGKLATSGSFPELIPSNPRTAFRDFEASARAGYGPAWFQLGRDYEGVGDLPRARDCFERGAKAGVESCCYRLGMANLLGQLDLPIDPVKALPLLHRAATLASIEVPQPAYVYGLLLLSEFSHVSIPPALFNPFLPGPSATLQTESRKFVERAAYLGFSPAQYKLGHAYEYADPPFPFDPLLSVQYYSLASQQGEVEADMALSKWFLCGAEGSFDKDERLAYTFAEKAARKGLPSAEFAMGYYLEVGVGGIKDVDAAVKWYTRAAQHGNEDAPERLRALSHPSPNLLSREEHEAITNNKLVRKRTQARNEAVASGRGAISGPGAEAVVNAIRKNSLHQQPQQPQQVPLPQSTYGPPSGPTTPNELPPGARRPTLAGNGPPPPVAQPPPQTRPQTQNAPVRHSRGQSLVDPGFVPPPPDSRQSPSNRYRNQSPQSRPSGGPHPPRPVHSNSVIPIPASTKGPATFQEMGFQSQKMEEKECRVM
ncbi:HCP-like protein [Sistotremastrum niveocremeum HHB9708]|uniref:HCP-like protein n=1 Tax=Sistotremastrum niveocremeum HHB9708 TaxID=1314777 RepID=A0A164ZZY3_9AGAM|nr:HCP-like protein [Sistotremastrum niveocremeum HHB9708]